MRDHRAVVFLGLLFSVATQHFSPISPPSWWGEAEEAVLKEDARVRRMVERGAGACSGMQDGQYMERRGRQLLARRVPAR